MIFCFRVLVFETSQQDFVRLLVLEETKMETKRGQNLNQRLPGHFLIGPKKSFVIATRQNREKRQSKNTNTSHVIDPRPRAGLHQLCYSKCRLWNSWPLPSLLDLYLFGLNEGLPRRNGSQTISGKLGDFSSFITALGGLSTF